MWNPIRFLVLVTSYHMNISLTISLSLVMRHGEQDACFLSPGHLVLLVLLLYPFGQVAQAEQSFAAAELAACSRDHFQVPPPDCAALGLPSVTRSAGCSQPGPGDALHIAL